MGSLRASIALLASLSLGSTTAAATPKGCVTEVEAAAIFAAMMPDIIDGLRDKCGSHLASDAYLVRSSDALIARYKVVADQRWPTAKLAFGKIAGEEEITKEMPDQFLRPLIGSVVGAELVKDIKTKDCQGANMIVESLAPLPPENVSMLMGAVLTMVGKGETKKENLPICEANAG